jgi:hypothetical protein
MTPLFPSSFGTHLVRAVRVLLVGLLLLPLLARAGTPVLTIQGTIAASATDVTAFVDRVELIDLGTGAVVASGVPNADFETTGSLGTGTYGYAPTGASWAFSPQSGIATNGSAFNNPNAPDPTHVAFLQTNSAGAGNFSQTLPSLPAGLYQLRVQVAQRNTNAANQGIRLLLDGAVVGTYVPANDGVFHSYTTPVFAIDAALRFEGTGSPSNAGNDVTAFLDQVEIINMATNTVLTGAVPNLGFENTGSLGTGSYGYTPTGTGWAFNPQSGIASNASAFGNPNAPENTHVAFLQQTGTVAQPLLTLPAGTYQVRVRGAQRGTSTADQAVRMLVNGVVLATFTPTVGSFQTYQSASFTIGLPIISSFTPTSGPTGTSVTISGTYLGGATSVSFNGTPQTVFTSNTGSSLVLNVPAGATSGPLTVTTGQGTSAASSQSFTVGPTISSVAPTPGGLGQCITLTGLNLSSPTALTINGANALANIVSNTGTVLVVRVPTTATATGTVSLTTAGGTATSAFSTLAAPGNALAFNGSNNYVSVPDNAAFSITAAITLEAWVRTSVTGEKYITTKGENSWYLAMNGGGGPTGAASFWLNGPSASGGWLYGTTNLADGRWHHVAGTYDGTTLRLYVDGVQENSRAATGAIGTGNSPVLIGNRATNYWNGSIDELRIYNTALTAGNVQADMVNTTAAVPGSLVAYFNFDQGTPGGNNAGLTTVYDLQSTYAGTLSGFALSSGNSTSNWVESYALVRPTATAATAVLSASFTANWTAPALGTVDNGYRLDVATDAAFTAPISGSPFTVSSGTSQALTGLAGNTVYYYRVRANKTSVTGQGAPSNTISLTTPPALTITSISPAPGVRGEAITITGTNLSTATAVSVNGVAATTASFVNNTATSLTVRVPATAGATGTTSVSTATSTASLTTFTTVAAAPPGNALAFDGTDDYVALPTTAPVPVGNAAYTVEAWIKPTAMGNYGIIGWGNFGTANQVTALRLTATGIMNYWWSNDLSVTTPSLVGRWHHVAATYDGTTRRIYLDGALVGSDTPAANSHAVPSTASLRLGLTSTSEYFPGALDEVRVYSAALTVAQVQADMLSTASALPGSLALYFNFDQGTAGGTNTGQTTLYDQTATAAAGTLTNFALTGSTSNYVESYALVIPTATAATALTGTGFTANWTAPAFGTVDNGYRLEVATDAAFTAPVTGSPFTVSSGTSRALTGLTTNTTYYYRVRADKTSVTGQSATSNVVSVLIISTPAITSFTPTSGSTGNILTLNGSNLTTATAITFSGTGGNVTTTGFVVNAAGTQITGIAVPGGAVTGPLTVTTIGGTSAASSQSFTMCQFTLVTQNQALTLAANGTGSVTAAAFNTGSSSTCGAITATARKTGVVYGTVAEGGNLTLTAPAGTTFTAVNFASFGTPTGTNGAYTQSSCHATTSQSVVEAAVLNNTGTVSIPATNANFGGDPCSGTAKLLAVRATYASTAAATSLAYTCSELGSQGVLLTLTDAAGGTTTTNVSVTVSSPPLATITSLSPQPAAPGVTVTAVGTNLSGATALTVNGATATISGLSATGFSFVVPSGATPTGNLVLTLPCAQALTQTFNTGVPTITSFTPASGPVGTSVSITGSNLTSATGLTLNGTAVPLANITTNTATSLIFTVPTGATTGVLRVTTAAGTSAASSTVLTITPGITSFTPTSGGAGTSVTITGTNLSGATAVRFNGVVQTVMGTNTAISLTVNVPAGATTGTLTVTTAAGTSPASSQTFYVGPGITSFTPTYGPTGTSVAITGVNLASATALTLNGATVPLANITSNTATRLVFTVPTGATSGPIVVSNSVGSSPPSSQNYIVTTTATNSAITFAPDRGMPGTVVTVTSASSALAGATVVTVNGVPGSILSNTATTLTFAVGAGSTTGLIVVRTPTGTAISSTNFLVGMPLPACFEAVDTISTAANGGFTALARDDDSFVNVPLGFNFAFYGTTYTSCYIGNNGLISFGSGVSSFTPEAIPTTLRVPIIAPYWADVDTRQTGNGTTVQPSGRVWYKLYPDRLVVIWCRVGYYNSKSNLKNTFQLILRRNTVAPAPVPDVTFVYGNLQWERGDVNTTTSYAQVGFDSGDGVHYYSVPGTLTHSLISTLPGTCLGFTVGLDPQPTHNSLAPTANVAAFGPNPAGAGQDVTLVGSNLAGISNMQVNGANATASLTQNTATAVGFRVPAGATLGGSTIANGSGGRTVSTDLNVLPAPGNALGLDGTDDYAILPHTAAYNLTGLLTVEAWVRTTATTEQYLVTKGEDSWRLAVNGGAAAAGKASFYLTGPSNSGGWLHGTTTISDGHWHHVAGTYNGNTLKLYVDGVLENSRAATGAVATGSSPLYLGYRPTVATARLNGALDEVRIWREARSPAELLAGLRNVPNPAEDSLVVYLNFDRGTPGGQNLPYTTSNEVLSGTPATLVNMALTGATSNYVESYAQVVPQALNVTNITPTSFTISWLPPAVGSVTSYVVDVATTATFTTPTSTTLTLPTATLLAVTGRTANTTYYYRVRADRTPIAGQGAYITGSVTTPTTVASCAATVSSFTPTSGTINVTTLTLTGTGFTPGTVTAVKFGGVSTTAFTVTNATTITVVVPAGAVSGSIGVVTSCGTASSAAAFTVITPTLTQISPAAELPGQTITITGTNFVPGSAVSFGLQPSATVTYLSPTALQAEVPPGVEGTTRIVVNTPNGNPAVLPFTVLAVADYQLNACATATPVTYAADNNWHYVFNAGGQVVLAYNTQGRNLGTVGGEYYQADPTQPVRLDVDNRYYLSRNWHLTTSAGLFTGSSVKVRFYGLTNEYAQLQAADPVYSSQLSRLRLTQYSLAGEDCVLNNNTTGTAIVIDPITTYGPTGSGFFVAEATVPNHFSEFYMGATPLGPLPVVLTAFTAQAEGKAAARLRWTTASEKNSAWFDVERSSDGSSFEPLGQVAAQGTKTSPTSYTFLDSKLPAAAARHATYYYRLHQVDLDGTASYSPVRAVTLDGKAEFTLYPNPAHSAATVSGLPAGARVEVLDALGRPVATATATADASGTAQLALPTGLAAGVYLVRSGSQVQRLVVE